jgi:hypothetical protein
VSLKALIKSFGARISLLHIRFFQKNFQNFSNYISRSCHNKSWIIIASLYEFLGRGLPVFAARCVAHSRALFPRAIIHLPYERIWTGALLCTVRITRPGLCVAHKEKYDKK